MFVHQSPRRHSARPQNAYEDGTDEDEQDLLQPADRYDRRERLLESRRSSPQDQHPRHTQLLASSRLFAYRQCAPTDASSGPDPNALFPAHNAGEAISETVHADPAHNAGEAALPPSVQPRYQSHTRTSGASGACATSHAAEQPAGTSSRAERRHHQERTPISLDPGGGRGLYSSSSEPIDSMADLERKSAFYRNANHTRKARATAPPLVLPELPIQKFTGDLRCYPMFRNRFLKTVGERPDLDPSEKFQYLIQYLDGEPLRMSNGYIITDNNYFKFLDRLEDRYGDTSTLATLLARDFFELQPVGQTLSDLQRFHEEAYRITDQMEQLGQDVNGNIFWRPILLSKLPSPLRLKIFENLSQDPMRAPVQEILARISAYARLVEKCETYIPWNASEGHSRRSGPQCRTGSGDADASDLSGPQCRDDPEPTQVESAPQRVAAAVANTIADHQLQERRTCPLCGLLHQAADCTVYDTTKKRLRRVQKLKMCLLCLREGHPAASCPRRTTHACKFCRHGQHNRALCMVAIDGRQRTVRHPGQVCATKGSNIDPEASDPQRHSRTSAGTNRRTADQSVNRDDTNTVPTATTLRQSGTQSSLGHIHGNLINRKMRPKDLGTDPRGRPGTNRPPTTSTDESMKQYGADAYGSDRFLPGRYDLLRTDKCSTQREMLQLGRTNTDGPGGAEYQYELYDEGASHQPSEGLRTDAAKPSPDAPEEPWFPPYEESTAYVACASDSDEQPAVLQECLAVTATNPFSKKSRRAVIMFDSGSSYSQISSRLAQFLDLPRQETRVQNVCTFGSETSTAFNGFRTFLVLCSEHGRCLQINVTALDRIVHSVRTALISQADLPALRSGDRVPTPTRQMPDLLIGQDLVHLFDRHLVPTLPCGYYVVQTSMGPTIGGACLSVTPPTKASSSCPHAALPAAEDSDTDECPSQSSISPPPSKFEPLASRHHLRLPELAAYLPAHNAGDTAASPPDLTAYRPAHNPGDTAFHDNDECLGSSTSSSISSRQPSRLSRVLCALPRSPQKQLSTNPLDAQLLLLPAHSTTYVDVEEVTAAHNAAGLPRPTQEPLSSREAKLRCSSPLIPPLGNMIRAPLHEAGSTLKRKTRLRCHLPNHAWQTLGIYAAQEPVYTVISLPISELARFHLVQAERGHLLVLMPILPPQLTIVLRTSSSKCLHAPQLYAMLLRNAFAAVLCGHFRAALRRHSISDTELQHTLDWTGSCHDCLRWLRSPHALPTRARGTCDRTPHTSAHPQPPASTALVAAQHSSIEPTPQPLTFQPVGPPSVCLPLLPADSIASRVRIDPHPTVPAQGPTVATLHFWTPCIPAPAACGLSSRISQRARVRVSRVPAALKQLHRRLQSSSLATTPSNMGRRKSKKTAVYTDFPAIPAGSTFHRAHEHAAAEAVYPREALAAEQSPPDRRMHITRHPKTPTDTSQGASDPAHNAGLTVSATRTSAPAATSVIPAHNAGSQVLAQDTRRPQDQRLPSHAAQHATNTKAAKRTAKPSKLSAKRPSHPAKNKGSSATAKSPAKAKTPATKQPTQLQEHRAHAQASPSGPQCRSVNLFRSMSGNSGKPGPQCRLSRTRNRGSTTAILSSRTTEPPPKLPDEQLSPAEITYWEQFDIEGARLQIHAPTYARTDADFRKEIDDCWNSWCTYHPKAPMAWTAEWSLHKLGKHLWARYQRYRPDVFAREVADLDAVSISDTSTTVQVQSVSYLDAPDAYPPDFAIDDVLLCLTHRAPRADLVDQKRPSPPHWPAGTVAVSKCPTTHVHATRATQEPLEPLAHAFDGLASTPTCAFCGHDHLSCECDTYRTVAERMRRTIKLGRCFSCLGLGHQSSACPVKVSIMCSRCRHQHHEAICRDAAPSASDATSMHSAFCRAPRISASVAPTPTAEHASRTRPTTPVLSNSRRTCAFCQAFHGPAKCTAYTSANHRRARARELQLCFVCLRNGHRANICPSCETCKICSTGGHHQALCRSRATFRRRSTAQLTSRSTHGTHEGKKRVSTACISVNDRNVCPPKNETICFCDASTFQQFGRQLRTGVCMIETPLSTSADATTFVCSFRPTSEAKRVLFWFSAEHTSLNNAELVRLVVELSRYYTAHYETILQYVIVPPSASNRQDVWTYSMLRYLVQAQVLLPDARRTTLPHDSLVYDDLVTTNGHIITNPPKPLSCTVQDVKHCLREHHQLDLWIHYHGDNFTKPGIVKVAAHNAASETPSTSGQTLAAAHNAVALASAPPPISAPTAKQNPCVQEHEAATDARAVSKLMATPDAASSYSIDAPAIAATAASHNRRRGHSDHHGRHRDTGPAPRTHDFDAGPRASGRPPNKDCEHNQ